MSVSCESLIRSFSSANLQSSAYFTVNLPDEGTHLTARRSPGPLLPDDHHLTATRTPWSATGRAPGRDADGMKIEPIQTLFDVTTGRPTGQRGFFGWLRAGADCINPLGMRILDETRGVARAGALGSGASVTDPRWLPLGTGERPVPGGGGHEPFTFRWSAQPRRAVRYRTDTRHERQRHYPVTVRRRQRRDQLLNELPIVPPPSGPRGGVSGPRPPEPEGTGRVPLPVGAATERRSAPQRPHQRPGDAAPPVTSGPPVAAGVVHHVPPGLRRHPVTRVEMSLICARRRRHARQRAGSFTARRQRP